jgi:hypothetical protein
LRGGRTGDILGGEMTDASWFRAVALSTLALAISCSGGGGGDDPAIRKQMADDLVKCQNERLNFKEQLQAAQAELKQLKEAQNPTVKLDPIELRPAGPAGEKHVEGNLPPEAVMKVFKTNQGALRACYEHGLKRNPNLQYVASVNAKFAVKNTGSAVNVGFSPHADVEMEKCMAQAIGKWKFPSFTGDPVQFDYPVSLVAK